MIKEKQKGKREALNISNFPKRPRLGNSSFSITYVFKSPMRDAVIIHYALYFYNLTLTWMFSMLRKKNVDQWNNAMVSGCTDMPDWRRKKINERTFMKFLLLHARITKVEERLSPAVQMMPRLYNNDYWWC